MYENLGNKYSSWEGWVLFARLLFKFLTASSVSVFEIKCPVSWLLFGVLKANFEACCTLLCSSLLLPSEILHSFRPSLLSSSPTICPALPCTGIGSLACLYALVEHVALLSLLFLGCSSSNPSTSTSLCLCSPSSQQSWNGNKFPVPLGKCLRS